MKKIISTLVLTATLLVGTSAFILNYSTGIAGYAGSPGEGTCSNCHSGGSSSASGVTITSSPAFSVNALSELEYFPDSVYTITIDAQASGFTRYGFASQVLNDNHTNTGTLSNAGAGVKFLNVGAKRTAVHTNIKTVSGVVSFTYKWNAPSAGNGNATIYAIVNAVNGSGNTLGDFVLSPVNTPLVEGTPPPPADPVGLSKNTSGVSKISFFPNPASDLATMSYYLAQSKTIQIELLDIQGRVVKQLYHQDNEPGAHTQILNVQGAAQGVYFIRISADGIKISQKLITVQ